MDLQSYLVRIGVSLEPLKMERTSGEGPGIQTPPQKNVWMYSWLMLNLHLVAHLLVI